MKKIQWAAFASLSVVVGAAVVAGAARSGAAGASGDADAPAEHAQVLAADAAAAADGFRPSEVAGVSVRERPSGLSAKGRAGGLIELKPGEPRTAVGGAERRSFTVLRKEKGTTALGGDKLVGAGLVHTEIATREASGRIKRGCVPGESQAAHAKHMHTARKAAAKTAR